MKLTINDQLMARTPTPGPAFEWQDGVPLTLRDLIRERVLLECDRRNAALLPWCPLVEGRAQDRKRDEAVAQALEGFARNAFCVLVDNRQLTELDDEIALTPATRITFLRLLPLKSG